MDGDEVFVFNIHELIKKYVTLQVFVKLDAVGQKVASVYSIFWDEERSSGLADEDDTFIITTKVQRGHDGRR